MHSSSDLATPQMHLSSVGLANFSKLSKEKMHLAHNTFHLFSGHFQNNDVWALGWRQKVGGHWPHSSISISPESSSRPFSDVSQQTMCDSTNGQFFKLQLYVSACSSSVSPTSRRPLAIRLLSTGRLPSDGGDRLGPLNQHCTS